MAQYKVVKYLDLKSFTKQVFQKMGCSEQDAEIATVNLLKADLRGIDSHGIARLIGYVRLWKASRIITNQPIEIIHETPSTATVDGKKGLGLIVGSEAMQIAIDKAKKVGTGWVAVKNSNHFGIAGNFAMMALEHDMIGMAMTNASALVAPTFSKQRMLGTNPIAYAFPAGDQPPVVADFATTTAANGKLEILQREGNATPEGWVQDKEGLPSHDAAILKKGGALLPLGGSRTHGSHKGFALGSIVDILTGVLSGASFGPWAPPFPAYVPMPENMPGEGLGHFFGAMRIDAFQPIDIFKNKMDLWITTMKNATPINNVQPVVIPGEPERLAYDDRIKNGIPVIDSVMSEIQDLNLEFNINYKF